MEIFLIKLAIAWKASHMTIFLSTFVCMLYSIIFPSEYDKKAPVLKIIQKFIIAGGFAFTVSSLYTITFAMVTLFHAY